MNEPYPLHKALAERRPVLGTWSIVADATVVEIACRAGLDFIILDLEHGTYDIGSLEAAIRAAEGAGAAPLVRVADLDPATFQRVLDLGAHGVIVPQIRSAADAVLATRCAAFLPAGLRGYNPFTRAANYAPPEVAGEGKLAGDFPIIGVIIENEDAAADLAQICAVPCISIVYLGVYDMSLALGCAGDVGDPRVTAFLREASATIIAAGKTVGLMVRDDSDVAEALRDGARFLVWGVEANVLFVAYRQAVVALEQALGRG